ncbi:hypothetical protein PROFUN_08682 [Planoprotostelium fungivorum]|uniref:UNC93-like protein n=1 Tax=Planoprotostelium fungivorum TaxID=1890364 RepID=A0A2P6MQS9_9EUKA|nr:hypothetical protein PROFUN_08682 [Planoprotostelium fungivorum]
MSLIRRSYGTDDDNAQSLPETDYDNDKIPEVVINGGRPHLINLLWLSFGFFLSFSAFNGTSNILTSIDVNVGFNTSAILYAAFCFGSLFLSTSFISLCGPKWSVFLGAFCYTLFQAANLKGTAEYMYPSAVLLGLGASVLWAAQGSYVTLAAANYALNRGHPADSSQGIFQGIFFGVFQCNQVVGNLISGFIFLYVTGDGATHTLFYVYLGISGAGLIFLFLLRAETNPLMDIRLTVLSEADSDETVLKRVSAVAGIHLDRKMLIMIPILYYNGLEQGFITGDFTANTKEQRSREWVGFSMAVFGVVNAVSSVLAGRAIRSYGKIVVAAGTVAHGFLLAFVIYVHRFGDFKALYADHLWVLFVLAAAAGVGDAVWTTYPNTEIGTLFSDRIMPGYSTMKLWNSLGNVTILVLGNHVPLWAKATLVAAGLLLSVVAVIVLHSQRSRSRYSRV